MKTTIEKSRRIELLLNELRYERHVRRGLVWALIDELDEGGPALKSAAEAARGLLLLLEGASGPSPFSLELDRIAILAGVDTAEKWRRAG